MKFDLKRKLRRKRVDRRLKRSGWIYHHHYFEIVVSENELLIQLAHSNIHTNLLHLLMFGKELPDYELRLMRATLKFEFLGSLVFPVDSESTGKPPLKVYIRNLFESFYETADEIKEHIERIVGNSVTDEFARKIFRKLCFIIYTCCPLMADASEIWWEPTYRVFLEFAIENDTFPFPAADSIWDAYPKDLPKDESLCSFLLAKLPPNFTEKVIYEDTCDRNMRF